MLGILCALSSKEQIIKPKKVLIKTDYSTRRFLGIVSPNGKT